MFSKRSLIFALMKIYYSLLILLYSLCCFGQAEEAQLLGRWQDSTLVGSFAHKNAYNEIWGYAIPEHEYAIIGTTKGTHFIEVTDPQQPKEVFFVAGKDQGGIIIHRDYHDHEGYLYAVSDEGESSLQIIDLNQLPDTVTVVYDSDNLIKRSHNIFIDTTNALLYSLLSRGGITSFSAMTLFDISNPTQPIFINQYNSFGSTRASQVHDAYVRDNIAFLNLGPDGLAIVDFSDPMAPVTISTLTDYPDRGYNHSGWLSTDCTNYYMADENHGFDLKTIEVEDLCELEIGTSFNAEVASTTSIPHNQVVACNYLYTAYYYDGLRVYDISDPSNPVLSLFYDTYPEVDSTQFRGAWGVYPFLPSGTILVSDMQRGLFVFEGMGDDCFNQDPPACLMQNCLSTSTTDLSSPGTIAVYPNPVVNNFSIQFNLAEVVPNMNISLLSLAGNVLQQWTIEEIANGEQLLSFPLKKEVANGFYFLSLRTEEGVRAFPLVVNK